MRWYVKNIDNLIISKSIELALKNHDPIVALETTVITHGLPYPENLNLAKSLERELCAVGVHPALIGMIEGKLVVGLSEDELELLAKNEDLHKISTRDIGIGISCGWSGGTTVAATLSVAHSVGIRVFATGGIGGVHRGNRFDVSADLLELSRHPIIVVCAGAKAILDLPATVENLESLSVPILGFRTNQFPAFFSVESGIKVHHQVNSVQEIVDIALKHWTSGLQSAILVVNPPPLETALPLKQIESQIDIALREAEKHKIVGNAVTPFLLRRVVELSGGDSLKSNLDLLVSNDRLAGEIALAIMHTTFLP
jgi:pseudouridine-5'-phosphate glycosidase